MKTYLLIIGLLFQVLLPGCKVEYSFTGASIPPEAEYVSVQYFPNKASIVNPDLSQYFTEELRDRFTSQTRLQLTDGTGDLNFEGYISDYSVKPIAIQGDETAAKNRLTITVKVKYTNIIDPKQDFDISFSAYDDYESSESLDAVEDDLMETIVNQLTEDIFNKSVANW